LLLLNFRQDVATDVQIDAQEEEGKEEVHCTLNSGQGFFVWWSMVLGLTSYFQPRENPLALTS